MRDDVRKHLAEISVYGHGNGNDEESGGGDQQLQPPHGRQSQDGGDRQVQRRQVERHPGEVRSE